MEEVKKSHIALLAWHWSDGRYVLIYDDLPIGELRIDDKGRGIGRYHQKTWRFEESEPGTFRLRDAKATTTMGTLHLHPDGGAEEGTVRLPGGKSFRFLRDLRKMPVRMTISRAEGQPLMQFREEDEDSGKIQIDNMPAAAEPDFETLALWGLHLYLTGGSDRHVAEAAGQKPPIPPEKTPRRGERITTGGDGWMGWAIGLSVLVGFALGMRGVQRRKTFL